MNGVLVIDKPQGWTSHDVVQRARRVLGEKRIGHTGTLDPLATGVLVLCVGKGTRIARYFENDDKEYTASMRLGVTTDTLDADGRVLVSVPYAEPARTDIERLLQGFRGPIIQRPPVYSAIKVKGVPSHRLAREGSAAPLPERRITIHELELLEYHDPLISMRVRCSKGTYIRSLCADIGERLGMGAHVTALRRTRSGAFTVDSSITIEQLEQAVENASILSVMVSLSDALGRLPAVLIDDARSDRIRHGNPVDADPDAAYGADERVRILASGGQLLAIGSLADGRIVPETVLV